MNQTDVMVRLFLAEWELVRVCVFLLRWGSLRSQRNGVKYLMTFTDHPQRQSHVCLLLHYVSVCVCVCVCVCFNTRSDSFMLPDHERLLWTLHPWHRDGYKNVCASVCVTLIIEVQLEKEFSVLWAGLERD